MVRKTVVPRSVLRRADLLPQVSPARRVEAGRGLVEEEHLGLVHERQGQVEPAAHAAGVRADPPVGGGGEPDPFEQVGVAPVRLRPREAVQHGLEPQQLAPGHERGRSRRPAARHR